MLRLASRPTPVLAWLLATAYAAHAGEATDAASAAADQFKLMVGSALMTDYIYRGRSSHKRSRAVGKRQSACLPSIFRAFSSECGIHE